MTTEPKNNVETTSNLARWKIDDLASSSLHQSEPFIFSSSPQIWRLTAEKNGALFVKFYMEMFDKCMHVIVKTKFPCSIRPVCFNIRVLYCDGKLRDLIHPDVRDKKFKSSEDPFIWKIELPISGKIIIDVELLDVVKANSLKRKTPDSLHEYYFYKHRNVQPLVWRMLTDSILTDIDIHTSDGGTFRAHRSILAAQSPVFESMFSYNTMEKQLSAVNIPDMSSESCKAFLNYLYGKISKDEFAVHQVALVRLADKYGVAELKKECQDSLLLKINRENALERLQIAVLYGLDDLKRECLRFLVTFGKICEVKHELSAFLESADREVISMVFNEVLAAWNGF